MRHIIALSGGKDSTAMALRLKEIDPSTAFEYVITPTGDELPEMIDHWKRLSAVLGQRLTVLSSGISLDGLIDRFRALPNNRQRWCTRTLKIEPYKQFLLIAAPAISYVGLRADEVDRVGAVYGGVAGITQRYPLREWGWGVRDVWAYLADRHIVIPRRTDCARCYDQRLGEWWNLWRDHPDLFAAAETQETMTGHTFRSPHRDTWPVALKDLRTHFEKGGIPTGADVQAKLFDEAQYDRCRACTL